MLVCYSNFNAKLYNSVLSSVSYEAGATEEEETGKKAAKDQFAGT